MTRGFSPRTWDLAQGSGRVFPELSGGSLSAPAPLCPQPRPWGQRRRVTSKVRSGKCWPRLLGPGSPPLPLEGSGRRPRGEAACRVPWRPSPTATSPQRQGMHLPRLLAISLGAAPAEAAPRGYHARKRAPRGGEAGDPQPPGRARRPAAGARTPPVLSWRLHVAAPGGTHVPPLLLYQNHAAPPCGTLPHGSRCWDRPGAARRVGKTGGSGCSGAGSSRPSVRCCSVRSDLLFLGVP